MGEWRQQDVVLAAGGNLTVEKVTRVRLARTRKGTESKNCVLRASCRGRRANAVGIYIAAEMWSAGRDGGRSGRRHD